MDVAHRPEKDPQDSLGPEQVKGRLQSWAQLAQGGLN